MRLAFGLLGSTGFLVLLITFSPLVKWWGQQLAGPWADAKGDVLIVPAGSSGSRGVLGYSTYLRMEYALWVYGDGRFRRVVLTGGGAPPEALMMRDFLSAQGVPESQLFTETNSHSTRENAVNTAPLLSTFSGTKVLLTSDYHMFRARRTFEKVGVHVLPHPVPDVIKRSTSWEGRWPAFLDLAEETIKIVYYWGRGWI